MDEDKKTVGRTDEEKTHEIDGEDGEYIEAPIGKTMLSLCLFVRIIKI